MRVRWEVRVAVGAPSGGYGPTGQASRSQPPAWPCGPVLLTLLLLVLSEVNSAPPHRAPPAPVEWRTGLRGSEENPNELKSEDFSFLRAFHPSARQRGSSINPAFHLFYLLPPSFHPSQSPPSPVSSRWAEEAGSGRLPPPSRLQS